MPPEAAHRDASRHLREPLLHRPALLQRVAARPLAINEPGDPEADAFVLHEVVVRPVVGQVGVSAEQEVMAQVGVQRLVRPAERFRIGLEPPAHVEAHLQAQLFSQLRRGDQQITGRRDHASDVVSDEEIRIGHHDAAIRVRKTLQEIHRVVQPLGLPRVAFLAHPVEPEAVVLIEHQVHLRLPAVSQALQ